MVGSGNHRSAGLTSRAAQGIVYFGVSEATVTTAPPISVPSQVPGPPGLKAGVRWAIAACFFLSGGAGLVYEVLWSRHLYLLFGSTSESVAVPTRFSSTLLKTNLAGAAVEEASV